MKAEAHLEYLQHLISAKVGTEEAERNAMRIIYGGYTRGMEEQGKRPRSRRVVEEVMRIMMMWRSRERRAL